MFYEKWMIIKVNNGIYLLALYFIKQLAHGLNHQTAFQTFQACIWLDSDWLLMFKAKLTGPFSKNLGQSKRVIEALSFIGPLTVT